MAAENRRRGYTLSQHFRKIIIPQQHQTASVPHFPFQCRFGGLPCRSTFVAAAPSLKRLFVPYQCRHLFRRCGQGILRTAEMVQQQQETFRTDIGRKSQLQPCETFVLCHEICPLMISDGICSKCRLKTEALQSENRRFATTLRLFHPHGGKCRCRAA